jgi:hypothetical protein
LLPYLTENDIDFDSDVLDGMAAVALNVSATSLLGQSLKATKDRDNSFRPVWKNTRAWSQYLKKLFIANTSELSDWGIPIETSGEIKYPTPFKERAVISKAIIAKSNSYPVGTSPLQPYITQNKNNLTTISTNIANALAFDISKSELKASSVKATQDRDLKFDDPYKNLVGIGNFLKTLFPDNPKDLLLWGFDEVDTKAPAKLRTVNIKPLISKKIGGIVLGSVLTVTGTKPISLTKGKKGLGTPIIVAPGEELGMNKGFSYIIVTNPATIGVATFTVTTK